MQMEPSSGYPRCKPRHRPTSWCCSFNSPPKSPETLSKTTTINRSKTQTQTLSGISNSSNNNSFPNSPASSKSSLVSRMDPRRILSPGRVSPISDPLPLPLPNPNPTLLPPSPPPNPNSPFHVRLNLKGNRGACLALELTSDVLARNSPIFAALISHHSSNTSASASGGLCRIEVPDVDNFGAFRDTIELMFEEEHLSLSRRLINAGPHRAIHILQVSANLKFSRGVSSCLKYLESVPWSEEEEERLRKVFTTLKLDDDTSKQILARLNLSDFATSEQNLAGQLVWSITSCANPKARNELKSMVKGLLCKSSMYDKDKQDIRKGEIYEVCRSCLRALAALLEGATRTPPRDEAAMNICRDKPVVEIISWQVDNINWLFEILLDRQMAEDFVDVWADQEDLVKMHGSMSPMVRYELSRISAGLFIAMGTRKLQCLSQSRSKLFETWFDAMLVDFGWLQRCKKGLDMKEVEEAMGQALLTLPLKQQYSLFMNWFRHFSKHGNESPNLSKAFQIWWRRTFLRGSETHGVHAHPNCLSPVTL